VPVSPSRKKRQPALSDDDAAYLNAQFYGGYPVEELGAQLTTSVLLLQPTPELVELLTRNIPMGSYHVRMDEANDEDLKQAGALAVVSASHHIAETLLRLLYVHASHQVCPWAGLARLRGPDALRRIAHDVHGGHMEVRGRKTALFDVVADVCFGLTVARDELTSEQSRTIENSASWVEYAGELADGANVYNAYKHGIGLVHQKPVPISLSVGEHSWIDSMDSFLSFLRPSQERERARCDYVMEHRPLDITKRVSASIVMLLLVESLLARGARERDVWSKASPKVLSPDFTPDSARSKPASPFEVIRDADEFGGPPAVAAKRPPRDLTKLLVRRRPEAADDPDSQGEVIVRVLSGDSKSD
jgi:hypothetical protein